MMLNLVKLKRAVLTIAILIFFEEQVCAQYNTDEKRRDFYLEICKEYAPDAFEILKSGDYKIFVKFADGTETRRELLDRLNTVVHETCHSYNFKTGFESGWGNEGYFITNGIKITTKKGSYFPSAALNEMVPKEQQEKIFRYDTYVGGEPGNSSTLEGVYAFINEFSAYYHGTKVDWEMFKYVQTFCSYTDVKCWTQDFLPNMESTLYAFYEFRLFIAWYLIYAEEHESKVYGELINNQNLKVAFTLLETLFQNLVDDYFKTREIVVKNLIAAGNKIEVGDKFLYVVNGNSKSGNGIPDDDIKYLKSLYTSRENSMLEKFRVNGVNLSNYKQFLVDVKK